MMDGYDWDLEPPVESSVDTDTGDSPLYEEELDELHSIVNHPIRYTDNSWPLVQDTEKVDEWERRVNVATQNFAYVPGLVEEEQEQAEALFDSGEMLVYSILKDFGSLHANFYEENLSKRSDIDILGLTSAYNEAYQALETTDEDLLDNEIESADFGRMNRFSDSDDADFGSAGDSGIKDSGIGSGGVGDSGTGDSGTGDSGINDSL